MSTIDSLGGGTKSMIALNIPWILIPSFSYAIALFLQLLAIPKIGQPNDHSKLAAFLLSESNNWITGQIFGVDGGRSSVA